MSRRHSARRRRAYGRRQHELRQRRPASTEPDQLERDQLEPDQRAREEWYGFTRDAWQRDRHARHRPYDGQRRRNGDAAA